MNPMQVANELETFKMAHGRGQVITDAVKVIRDQQKELAHYRDMEAQFKETMVWIKRNLGRDLHLVFKRENVRGNLTAVAFKANDIQNFNNLMNQNHVFLPSCGVWK